MILMILIFPFISGRKPMFFLLLAAPLVDCSLLPEIRNFIFSSLFSHSHSVAPLRSIISPVKHHLLNHTPADHFFTDKGILKKLIYLQFWFSSFSRKEEAITQVLQELQKQAIIHFLLQILDNNSGI